MKLSIKKSGRFTYLYAVKGYRDDKGASTSKVVSKFGTIEELKERLNGEDPVEWTRARVAEMTALEKAALPYLFPFAIDNENPGKQG